MKETIHATYTDRNNRYGCKCNGDDMCIEYLDNVFGNPFKKIRYRFKGKSTIWKSRRYKVWQLFNGPFNDTEVKIINTN